MLHGAQQMDTPTCQRCGTPMDPVWCPDAARLMAWLCPNCRHAEKPIGREINLTPETLDVRDKSGADAHEKR